VINPTQTLSSTGGTVQYTFSASPSSGSYNSPITFSISGLPAGVTAAFVPPTITPGSSQASTTLTVTVAPLSAFLAPSDRVLPHPWGYKTSLIPVSLGGVLCLFARRRRNVSLTRTAHLLLSFAAIFILGGLLGCGHHSTSVIQPGTYTFSVTGTGAAGQHTVNITLVAQ
jgi:hypothetical protein